MTCNTTIGNWFNDWLGSSNLQILTKLYLARAIFQQPEPQRREKGTMIMMLLGYRMVTSVNSIYVDLVAAV